VWTAPLLATTVLLVLSAFFEAAAVAAFARIESAAALLAALLATLLATLLTTLLATLLTAR
jgi:hypothetical protein